jgi:hypothetical protein
MTAHLGPENLKVRLHLLELDVDEKVIVNWSSKDIVGKV